MGTFKGRNLKLKNNPMKKEKSIPETIGITELRSEELEEIASDILIKAERPSEIITKIMENSDMTHKEKLYVAFGTGRTLESLESTGMLSVIKLIAGEYDGE